MLMTWRLRFAFFPVRRWKTKDGNAEQVGWYWWKSLYEVKAGLLNEWTAYASYNDGM